jgi:Dehydrogenases with different specificities (related to short-chain alcohol dehydrogenases)
MNRLSLTDKVAVVTGGAKGMGGAHSELMAERGAKVVIADLDPVGQDLADKIYANGGEAIFVSHDVTDETSWENLIEATLSKFGKLNIMVNNAGVASVKPAYEATVEEYEFLFNVNMKGVFLGCKHAYKPMKAAGGGSIVNISSASSLKGLMPDLSLYSASKGAVRSYSKAVALEYVKDGIRVNTVHPGLVATTLNKEYLADPELRRTMLGNTMFDRPGECEEMAEMVAFLASDAASYMTGADIAVDGGWTAN